MESPFKRYLNTNYAPSVAEVHQIWEFISQPFSELASLNDRIAHLQSIIDDLTRERDDIVDEIDAHRALISPVRRLPQELLQEIFIRCLPTKRNAVMSAREAPVLLGHICSGWRRIALSTPHLWSSLHAVSPKNHPAAHEKFILRVDCLNVWLGRSGTLPLSISMVAPEYPEQNAQKIVASLIPFSRRWKSIELRVPGIALHSFLKLTTEDVPILETIKLRDIRVRTDKAPWTEMTFLGASRLHSASFPHFDTNPLVLPLPWAQLTELCLNGDPWKGYNFTAAIALRLLSQCPKLISCTLQIAAGSWGVDTDDTNLVPLNDPTTLPLLRSFHVQGYEMGDFFDHLILPELRDISMSGGLASGTPEHIAFRSLLARSHSLGSIALKDSDLLSEDLIECLQLAPSLTRLHFAGLDRVHDLRNKILRLLTPTQESPGLCPALEIMEFVGCNALSDEPLLRFIQARLTHVHPDVARLRRVEVLYDCPMELDILSQIQPLIKTGTEVSLIYPRTTSSSEDSLWAGLVHELPPLHYNIWDDDDDIF